MISHRTHGRMAWITGVALLCALPVFAQDNSSAQPNGQMSTKGGTGTQSATGTMGATGTGQASASDKHFVQEATEDSNAEIALGKLAQEKSNSQDVKQFGERMVTDHTKLNDQMAPVAQQMGLTVSPDQMSPKDQALQTKLQGLSGQQFDQAYSKAMVKNHEEDLKKFKKEVASTKDPTLKQTVEQGEQVISEHLQMAKQMAKQLAQAHNSKAGGMGSSSAGQ